MKSNRNRWMLVISAVLLFAAGVFYGVRNFQGRFAVSAQAMRLADIQDSNHIERRDDKIRQEEIAKRDIPLRRVSDEDLNWLLQFATKRDPGWSHPICYSDATAVLIDIGHFPPEQRTLILNTIIPYASTPNSSEFDPNGPILIRKCTAQLMGRLGDKKTIPYLLPMLQDSSPLVRARAKNALKELGGLPAPGIGS